MSPGTPRWQRIFNVVVGGAVRALIWAYQKLTGRSWWQSRH